MRDRSPGHCSTKRPRDGGPRALPCSPYIAPLGAPPRSSLVSPLRWPVCAAAAEVALRFSLRLARAHRASRLVTKSQKVTGGRRGGGGGVVTGRHPAAFSLRAARKIPKILTISHPGAASVPDARKAPAPPLFRSCAAAAGGRAAAITHFDCARACTVAGRAKYTPPASGALAVELKSSQACWRLASLNIRTTIAGGSSHRLDASRVPQ